MTLPNQATPDEIAAHVAAQGHKYVMHFPPHPPRASDPHYAAFNAFHRKFSATAQCFVGQRKGFDECSKGPLELHHAHIEFSLQNGINAAALAVDYPALKGDSADQLDAWVETDQNFRWLCAFHHRGHAGAHTAAHADWEADLYIKGLIT